MTVVTLCNKTLNSAFVPCCLHACALAAKHISQASTEAEKPEIVKLNNQQAEHTWADEMTSFPIPNRHHSIGGDRSTATGPTGT